MTFAGIAAEISGARYSRDGHNVDRRLENSFGIHALCDRR
jgi:hypothetical protein